MSCPTSIDPVTLRIGHSPDADDAFMWWAITSAPSKPAPLTFESFRFEVVMEDIESLNERSMTGELDITAISAAQYPHVADRYAITSCGASFGRAYGPKLVAHRPMSLEDVRAGAFPIAIPGIRTTAALICSMAAACSRTRLAPVRFDEVGDRVADGEFDVGVVIHEGQLTYQDTGLHLVADLGAWWHTQTDLPLPLGLNVIRRELDDRLGDGALQRVAAALTRSIRAGMSNRTRAVAYARQFGRGVAEDVADRFVELYVNPMSIDCGQLGLRAIETLLRLAAEQGLVPRLERVDVIHPDEFC